MKEAQMRETPMQKTVSRLKAEIRIVLGKKPSDIFLGRLDRVLDEVKDRETLGQAASRIERLVKLFIGFEEAKTISEKFREVIP